MPMVSKCSRVYKRIILNHQTPPLRVLAPRAKRCRQILTGVLEANKNPQGSGVNSMIQFNIKCFNPERNNMDGFKFYILSRGYNAGRPSYGPNPNCFVVWTSTQEDFNRLFYACKALFVTNRFRSIQSGSVIQLIRKDEVRKLLVHALKNSESTSGEVLKKITTALRTAEMMRESHDEQRQLMSEIQISLLHRTFIQPNPNF
jgi:hypothetical protein